MKLPTFEQIFKDYISGKIKVTTRQERRNERRRMRKKNKKLDK